MEKTYRQQMDENTERLGKAGEQVFLHLEIPHPNGKVYQVVEKLIGRNGNISMWSCFESYKENGEWIVKPVSKDWSDRMEVENVLKDLQKQFKDLLPKD